MKIFKNLTIIIIYFLLCSGCITSIKLHNKKSTKKETYQIQENRFSFFFNLFTPSNKVKPWKRCNTNWHAVEIKREPHHILTSILTIGIISPFNVTITCVKKQEIFNLDK